VRHEMANVLSSGAAPRAEDHGVAPSALRSDRQPLFEDSVGCGVWAGRIFQRANMEANQFKDGCNAGREPFSKIARQHLILSKNGIALLFAGIRGSRRNLYRRQISLSR
jgi:hypothetical protein